MHPPCYRWLVVALASLVATTAFAQTPKPEKTYSVAFENKPWGDVLDWFAKESGLVLIATSKPTGTVTIKTDPKKPATITGVVDLLNTAMAAKKFVLLRINATTFTVVPADEKIPDAYIRRVVDLKDLSKHGLTEVVQVVIPLKGLNAEEILDQVKQRLSPLGLAEVSGKNSLVVTDTVARIGTLIESLEKSQGSESLTYQCKYIRAAEAAESLTKLLSDRSTGVVSRFRTVAISVQERTNTVIVTGPADKLATAEKLLKELDVPPPVRPVPCPPPVVTCYCPAPVVTCPARPRLLARLRR